MALRLPGCTASAVLDFLVAGEVRGFTLMALHCGCAVDATAADATDAAHRPLSLNTPTTCARLLA
jgi:hypothetical protein